MEKIAFGSGLKELADFLLSSNEGDNYFKKEKKKSNLLTLRNSKELILLKNTN